MKEKAQHRVAPSAPLNSRVWIWPNRNTLGLSALIVAMWYAGASQNNGAAYLLCFTIGSTALISILHSWANLRGISLKSHPIEPVFAGDEVCAGFTVQGSSRKGHASIRARSLLGGEVQKIGDLATGSPLEAIFRVPIQQRGRFTGMEVELFSLYPLGFFSARTRIYLKQGFVVYPKPMGSLPLPGSVSAGDERRQGVRIEGDDFAGVRGYQKGESQRHIDWKAVSRGQPMLVKQWAGDADHTLHLNWQDLSKLETEARLSQIAAWVLKADRRGCKYSLTLPGIEIPASLGEAHRHTCLEALASFALPSQAA